MLFREVRFEIALAGHGKKGSALLLQWCAVAHDRFPRHRFIVIDSQAAVQTHEEADRGTPSPGVLVFLEALPPVDMCRFDLVMLAVKPQVLDAVLPDYVERLTPEGFIASISAGAAIARLKALGGGAPVVRIMPNVPATMGAGLSGLCADPSASATQKAVVQSLMEAVGSTLWVEDEDQLDRLTAIADSGPGYVFEIARAYATATAMGFAPDVARTLCLDLGRQSRRGEAVLAFATRITRQRRQQRRHDGRRTGSAERRWNPRLSVYGDPCCRSRTRLGAALIPQRRVMN
jgi:pyrroline-5-carboxylate reductase